MIINNKAHDDDSLPEAGPSSLLQTRVDPFTDQPPPPFEEQPTEPQEHLLIDLAENYHSTSDLDNNSEPPPDFSPYHADYFETDSGDIVSHDPHLNTDGEALYRFLLSRANNSPSYRLYCRGTHSEHRTRWVRETNSEGRTASRRENFTEMVTDFDFCIDVGPRIASNPIHWSVADNEPAYRGLMVQETEQFGIKQTTKRAEKRRHNKWVEERKARGLPPWITSISQDQAHNGWFEGLPDDPNSLKSSKTLRQWADEYCASQKYLKEFKYEKVLYGWNLRQIESAVRSSIQATMYHGSVEVDIKTYGSKIFIRPDNRLSRMLSNKWLKFLSMILLVFPFIWLFKRFHSKGGGRWEICGGAYALKCWVPVEAEDLTEEEYSQYMGFGAGQSATSQRLRRTPNGITRLVGLTEGEWFRKWEQAIMQGVRGHYQSSTPIFDMGHDVDHNSF